jgi:Protein of unknown function (DUF3311)
MPSGTTRKVLRSPDFADVLLVQRASLPPPPSLRRDPAAAATEALARPLMLTRMPAAGRRRSTVSRLSSFTNLTLPSSSSHFSLLTSHILVHGSAMGSEDEPDHSDQDGITIGAIVLAAIPFLALILGPFIANRLEPRIFGLPFLLAYCVFWVLLTPVFLFCVDRLRKRR